MSVILKKEDAVKLLPIAIMAHNEEKIKHSTGQSTILTNSLILVSKSLTLFSWMRIVSLIVEKHWLITSIGLSRTLSYVLLERIVSLMFVLTVEKILWQKYTGRFTD